MAIEHFSIETRGRDHFVDITKRIQDTAHKLAGAEDCAVVVFVPHTTAGVTINENGDPHVVTDVINKLDEMVPWVSSYKHAEGNSAAHVKASLMGSSVTIPYAGGQLLLGTWQSVYLCEFDGPRRRRVFIQAICGTGGV